MKSLSALILLFIVFLGWAINEDIKERKEWEKFKVEHKCKVVAYISGSTFNTIDAKGNIGVGATDPKTGWLCDDGITYYR